jgi:hypothetical protein
MRNAKQLRKYTARQEKKIWKAKCRAHRSIIYEDIYNATKQGKYSCTSFISRKNQSEVCSNIFIHSITQELEKKGFYVDITSDTFYNYFNISWAKKK